MESLEDRKMMAFNITLTGSAAVVTGDGSSDTFIVDSTGGNLRHNRAGDAGFNSAIDWNNAVAGDQTLAVNAASAISFDMGGGDDVLQLGTAAIPATSLLAAITYNSGGAGNDSLIVDNSAAPAVTLNYTSTLVTGGGLNLNNLAILENGETYRTGAAGSITNISSDLNNLSIIGNSNSTVNIGSTNTLANITGNIAISNPPSFTTLNISDAARNVAHTVSWTADAITGLTPSGTISYVNADTANLTISTGAGIDTFNINDSVSSFTNTINAGDNDDVFNVTAGGLAGASINAFNGESGNDSLTFTFAPGVPVVAASMTFNGGGNADTLTTLGGNFATGVSTPINATDGNIVYAGGTTGAATINYTGLSPINDLNVVAAYTINATNALNFINIVNGPVVLGTQTTQVNDGGAGFELLNIANKTAVTVNSLGGSDQISINNNLIGVGLTSLIVNGDDGDDQFNVSGQGIVAGVAYTLNGGNDNDLFSVSGSLLPSPITVNGDTHTGGTPSTSDRLNVNSFVSNVTRVGNQLQFSGGSPITFNTLEQINLNNLNTLSETGTAAADTIVLSKPSTTTYRSILNGGIELNFDAPSAAIGAQYFANTSDGSDTLTVDNAGRVVNLRVGYNAGNGVNDTLNVFGNPGTPVARETYIVGASEDQGRVVLDPDGNLGYLKTTAAVANGDELDLSFNGLDPINTDVPAVIFDIVLSAAADNGTLSHDGVLLNGAQSMLLTDNSATFETTRFANKATTTISGFTGTDTLTWNINGSLAAGLTNLEFYGFLPVGLGVDDAPASNVNRDTVVLNDVTAVARNVVFAHSNTASVVDVTGITVPTRIGTAETVRYTGGGNDLATVSGSVANSDLITAVPISPTRAIVFDGGNPFDGPPDVNSTSFPGIAGGSTAPDLDLQGLVTATGLTIQDNGATTGDRLYVYGESEAGLNAGGTSDPFGFGAGLIMPAVGAGNAYDVITSNDVQTVVNNYIVVHYDNVDFVQSPPNVLAAVVVNAGFEGNPPITGGTDVADSISLTLSAAYKFQVNGGDPDPATTGIVPPDGDALNISGTFPVINVFSNKNPGGVPVVSFEFPGSGNLGFSYSSIENLGPWAAGTVNLIGDNNDPAVDQNDNFVVVGRDVDFATGGDVDGSNEFTLRINGSDPIPFRGVQFLNAFGDDQNPPPGTPSVGPNHIDTLEVTPYADDTPRGWGIDVAFNEGNPVGTDGAQADLLILHTSLLGGMVSENIVVKPSGTDDGEVIVTNASFGTPIVDIDYVANTDIIVRDDDGFLNDTDTLTLLGTNPNTAQVSGNETFAFNADAAMDAANPLVTVTDTNSGLVLYRLREFTTAGNPVRFLDSITLNGLAGNDTFNLVGGQTTQQDDQYNFLGGEGDDALNIDMPNGFMFDGTGLFFDGGSGRDSLSLRNSAALNNAVTSSVYTVGAAVGAGQLRFVDGFSSDMVVDFANLEPVVDTIVSANLIVNATNANNAINYGVGTVVANGLVSVDDQETIEFSNKTTLTINSLAGSDTINLNNPNTPTALTTIAVNAGDPTGSDTLIVNGRAGLQDQLRLLPTAQGAGSITQTGVPTRNYTGIENIRAVMDPVASDHLTIDGTAGNDTYRITSGPNTGAEIITGEFNAGGAGGPFTLPTITATGQSSSLIGTLNFNGVGGTDNLVLTGTSSNETFNFFRASATSGSIDHDVNNLQTNFIGFANFATITVEGLDGDDTFNVPGNFPTPLTISGGNPSNGSDVLNVTGAGAALTVNLPTSTITETGFAAISYVGIEDIAINGGAAALSVNGTTADDRFDVQPTASGTGSLKVFTTGAIVRTSPQFTYANVNNGSFTLNGDTGFDEVHILGNNAVDTITATAASITRNAGTVSFGTALERANIESFDGNDSIDISSFASVVSIIRGGLGDDTIVGSTLVDLIYGGSGNDVLRGGAGGDTIYGEDGDDTFGIVSAAAQDAGNDFFFGGDGSDLFIWNPGDGNDMFEGGAGESDRLQFQGNAAANSFIMNQVGTRLSFVFGAVVLDVASTEDVLINALAGADAVTINDLYATEVRHVTVDLTAGDVGDNVTVHGRDVSDVVNINATAGVAALTGLRYDVRVLNAVLADNDILTFNGNDGNDNVVVNEATSALYAAANLRVNGGNGNDFISGHGLLSGDAGDDTLIGGTASQALNGGDGNDTLNGLGGVDTMDGGNGEDTFYVNFDAATDNFIGGADYDTVLILGTSGNDVVAANQTAAGTIVSSLNGVNDTDSITTIERVRIEANSGDDIIFVQHLEALGTDAPTNNSVLFDVDGGAAFTADRLVVQDNGASNTIIYRKAETATNGSVTVGPVTGAITEALYTVFSGVEYVDPMTSNPQNIFVFKYDPFEWNGNIFNATHLGASLTINADPVIDPGIPNVVLPPGFNNPPADEDYYRIEAQETGTLDVQAFFRINTGLPGNGDINIDLLDADGTVIATDVDADDNARIRVPVVEGQIYYLRVYQGVAGALNTYSVSIINEAAPVPFDIELDDEPVNGATNPPGQGDNSDTGRSQNDNITYDNTPTIVFRVPDNELINDVPDNSPGQPGAPFDGTVIPINFQADTGDNALAAGFRVAVFRTENNVRVHVGYATSLGNGLYSFTFPAAIPDGSNFISARVEMVDPTSPEQNQGFGAFAAHDLEIFVDTVVPPVFFGQQSITTDGLHPNSDSGVLGPQPSNIATLSDRITNDTTPTFWGRSEADANIRAYLDVNGNGTVELATDIFLGFTTAIPYNGTNQMGNPTGNEPNGYWELTSTVNLDSQQVLTALGVPAGQSGGLRRILVTAEDVAGNITSGAAQVQLLNIFVDEQGPQVTGVEITGSPAFDLFDPKASTAGHTPTPLVNALTINVRDFPARLVAGIPGLTDYPALQETIAEIAAHYQVKGDYNGIIPIQSVVFTGNAPVNGQPATGNIQINFFQPLPDDRFTLTIQDDVVDPAGNRLDGEANAPEPQEDPLFPTGDGVPGGDFVARFTVDSRAELGTWAAGSAWIDTNGNTIFDQDNLDFTNRDIAYLLGFTSDELFAGNFANGGVADGFDKLAAYGRVGSQWRWQIDTDNDGVPNIQKVDPAGINGFPVSGDFAPGLPGDEVGLFTGNTWYLDTNGDFNLQTGVQVLPWRTQAGVSVSGYGFTGDFDGDGKTDLASWTDDTFQLDLSSVSPGFVVDGRIDATFSFGFPGARERPVAADMNRDGFDDIGLWTPDRTTQTPGDDAEWYFLMSGLVNNDTPLPGGGAPFPAVLGPSVVDRIVVDPINPARNIVAFTPTPFGNDLYMQYGDEFSLPIVGNFDPPVMSSTVLPATNHNNNLDVNNDGKISAFDAIQIINKLNTVGGPSGVPTTGFIRAPFMDVDGNSFVTAFDALQVINYLNLHPTGSAGEEVSWHAAEDTSGAGEEDLLTMLAIEQTGRRKENNQSHQ